MKKILIHLENHRVDLLIERDAGNDALILMGGKDEIRKENWTELKRIADEALAILAERK
jgi:hypothetical protein